MQIFGIIDLLMCVIHVILIIDIILNLYSFRGYYYKDFTVIAEIIGILISYGFIIFETVKDIDFLTNNEYYDNTNLDLQWTLHTYIKADFFLRLVRILVIIRKFIVIMEK